jgi:hypothetical protein
MAADGQVIFEISADGSKIDTAIGAVTKTIETEGKKWDSETEKSTKDMAGSFDAFSGKASQVITNLTGKIINMAAQGITKMMDYSDAVDKGSKSMGISAKAYQELDYAMNMSGANIDTLTRGVGNLNSALAGTASNEVKNALSGLGISEEDLKSMSNAEELLDKVLYTLAGVEDTAARADIANSLFGVGAGSQLAAFLAEGETGIKNLRQQAEDLGIVKDDEAIAQAVKTKDSIDTLNETLNGALMEIITPLLPAIQSLVELITPFIPIVTDIMNVLNDLLDPIFKLAGIDRASRSIKEHEKEKATAAMGKTDWLDAALAIYRGEADNERVNNMMKQYGTAKEHAQYSVAKNNLVGMGFDAETAKNMAQAAYELAYHKSFDTGNSKKWASGDENWYNSIGAKYADSVDAVNAKNAQLATALNGVSNAANNAAAAANHAASALNSVNAPVGSGAIVSGAIASVLGAHANGLDYVPYDGYFAMLHQGERVQTAAEADLSRRYGNQAPGADIGGAIRAGMGNMQIIWRGRVVADVLSEQQGDSFRALERSGWKS